jgi:hypothetical protein
MAKTYCVVYRTGGRENFQWHRSLAFPTRLEAVAVHAACEAAGRRAVICDYNLSGAIGLPETFEYDGVDEARRS